MSITRKLAELGLTLPAVPAPVAAYVNCVRSGNLLFISGGLPIDGDRKILDKVRQIVALNGFVNSDPDFHGHPQVINGASELLVEIFGERGKHSRTALGAAALPLNVAVEINLVVEVEA